MSDAYSNLSSSNVGVVTSVDGFPLKILGKALMKFDIQSEVFPCEAHVIEGLTYDVILGRDFLQKYSSKIDFDKAVIEFSLKENPFPFCGLESLNFDEDHLPDDTSFVCTVHADFSFVIPPESEVVVPAVLNCLTQIPNATGLVAPRSTLPEKYSVLGASELVRVSDDGKIPIRMINPSAQPVKIYRRTKLGDFEQVDPSPSEPSESSRPSPQPSSNDSQRDYSEFPDLSDSTLCDGEKNKFKELFHKYRVVFAFSNDQLGRTSLVKHVIDTGDATPICCKKELFKNH